MDEMEPSQVDKEVEGTGIFSDMASLKQNVRTIVESNRIQDLHALKCKGLNLKIFLDDLNNTPLILASHLGLESMMTYIVLNEPSLHEEDIIATATEILHKLAHTRDTSFLGHLNTLVQCWNSRNSMIPYTFIVQAAFKILRAPPKDLLASFCENALKVSLVINFFNICVTVSFFFFFKFLFQGVFEV